MWLTQQQGKSGSLPLLFHCFPSLWPSQSTTESLWFMCIGWEPKKWYQCQNSSASRFGVSKGFSLIRKLSRMLQWSHWEFCVPKSCKIQLVRSAAPRCSWTVPHHSHIKQSIGIASNICLRLEEKEGGLWDKKGTSVSLDTLNHSRVS